MKCRKPTQSLVRFRENRLLRLVALQVSCVLNYDTLLNTIFFLNLKIDTSELKQGDSGGPLTFNGVHVGLTSFGSSQGCESGAPDAFTRTSYFRDWIREKTGV